MEKKKRKRGGSEGKKRWKEFVFFARRWSQLSTSVISPSLNLFTHRVLRYHSSGATFQVVMRSLFSFVPLLPVVQKLLQRCQLLHPCPREWKSGLFLIVFTRLFLSFPFSFPFTHIMTRLRAVALAAVMSLALLAQGGLVRFGERGSRRVQWFRLGERGGDDYQGFK